jgi:cold shock CspA family protein
MLKGTVIYFNPQTGVGVIMKEKGGGVFVEVGALRKSDLSLLYVGQKLSFEIIENRWGQQQAINLQTVAEGAIGHKRADRSKLLL